MKALLRRFLPKRLWLMMLLKRVYFFPRDFVEFLTRSPDEMMPPKGLIFTGSGNFKEIGTRYLNYFVEIGKLKPDDRVLDIGCGIGRMAIPLVAYLSPKGAYEGVDVVPYGIKWCQKHIASRHPNFKFHQSDVYNEMYNPKGRHPAAVYQFPYPDRTFDFIFLTSVFTHMLPGDVAHYFSEISRLLKNGSTCFITFFLLNDEALDGVQAGRSNPDFKCDMNGYRIADRDNPEAAIAYPETFILNQYREKGLEISEPIHYGSWCGRKAFLDYQDIVVATKRPS